MQVATTPSAATATGRLTRTLSASKLIPDEYVLRKLLATEPPMTISRSMAKNQVGTRVRRPPTGSVMFAAVPAAAPMMLMAIAGMMGPRVVQNHTARDGSVGLRYRA